MKMFGFSIQYLLSSVDEVPSFSYSIFISGLQYGDVYCIVLYELSNKRDMPHE